MKVRGSRVLVTGGSGLIGSHIVDRLVAGGAEHVAVIDRTIDEEALRPALESGRVSLHPLDVRDVDALDRLLADGADAIVHLAALLMAGGREQPRSAVEVNVLASCDLIQLALDHGVQRFVFGSTVGVYGQPALGTVTAEDAPINARTVYGASKFAVELLCRAFADERGLDYVALRYGSVYGPRQHRHGFFPPYLLEALDQVDAGEPVRLPGDPAEVHDFLYVGDAADAALAALEAPVSDVPVNVVSGRPRTLDEIFSTLLEVYGSPQPIEWRPREFTFVTERRFDAGRAEELLGFAATTELRRGLEALIDWRASALPDGRALAGSG